MARNYTLTPQQALELSLRLEGDKGRGLSVHEYVSSRPLEWKGGEDKKIEVVRRLASWKDSGKERLSSIPVEALYLLFRESWGADWFENELEVILAHIFTFPLEMDEGGVNKVIALYLLLRGPNDNHPFYHRIPGFEWMSKALVGKVGRVYNHMVPTAKDICLSSYIAYELRPMAFSEDVKAYVASTALYRGIWALPSYISYAQDQIYRISEVQNLEITPEKVEMVRKIAEQEAKNPNTIPEDTDNELEIQALHVVNLTTRVAAAIFVADNHVEDYLEELRTGGADVS